MRWLNDKKIKEKVSSWNKKHLLIKKKYTEQLIDIPNGYKNLMVRVDIKLGQNFLKYKC